MAKTWVLDTETKGTGASMVPLENVTRHPRGAAKRVWVPPAGRARPEPAPEPRAPRIFRVVDVMTRRQLGEGSVRETVAVLEGVRSTVDVNVHVWEPKRDAWRLLTLREKHVLWGFRRETG